MNLQNELTSLLSKPSENTRLSSELGFFSKPTRIKGSDGNEYILKFYRPIKNETKAKEIVIHHDKYVEALRSTGILIPPTAIHTINQDGLFKIAILQPAFEEQTLVRGIMETCDEKQYLFLLEKVLDDTLKFWKNKPAIKIGFHPTLRNYAWSEDKLHYFDTFPPMLTSQKELNKLIIHMAPANIDIRALIPNRMINRVSNEYYQKDKMIIGIIGSSCRLRPELSETILSHCRNYISHSIDLKEDEKAHLMEQLKHPPRLSGIWVTFRKLFGKTGKPNIK